jgi:hypothetical protein
MPETIGKGDTGALINQIRGYLQRGEMDYEVAMGLTLTSMADLLEAFQIFQGHTHPELKSMRRWLAPIGTAIMIGALAFVWGLVTHQIVVAFAP